MVLKKVISEFLDLSSRQERKFVEAGDVLARETLEISPEDINAIHGLGKMNRYLNMRTENLQYRRDERRKKGRSSSAP